MPFHLAVLIAVLAAAASLYAAQSKTMIPLRCAALAASLLALAYAVVQTSVAAAGPAAALAALNAWRLAGMLKLIRDINATTKTDMNVDWFLPYTRPRSFRAGHMLMKRGDYATQAFYIVSGEVEVVDIHRTFGKGTLLGEIGLFALDGRRIMSVRCTSDVETAVIDYDQFKELYFVNPQFGFRLLPLVVARLIADRDAVETSMVR